MNPRIPLAISVVAAGCLIALIAMAPDSAPRVADSSPSAFAGATMPPSVKAPEFSLTDQDGEPVTMREYRGRPVVVTFLYASCDETCPPQVQQIKGALDKLDGDIPALGIAVDPSADTPAAARKFLNEQRMTGRMRFVLGSEERLRPVWDGFFIQPQVDGLEHQSRIVLVDARGLQRVGYTIDQATPERIANDLRLLDAEAAESGGPAARTWHDRDPRAPASTREETT